MISLINHDWMRGDGNNFPAWVRATAEAACAPGDIQCQKNLHSDLEKMHTHTHLYNLIIYMCVWVCVCEYKMYILFKLIIYIYVCVCVSVCEYNMYILYKLIIYVCVSECVWI